MRSCVLLLLIIAGCQSPESVARAVIGRYGPPDLVCESAGDLGRCYLPGREDGYVWPTAERTLYYLDRAERVEIASDGTEQAVGLNTLEVARLRGTIANIRVSPTAPVAPLPSNLATTRGSPYFVDVPENEVRGKGIARFTGACKTHGQFTNCSRDRTAVEWAVYEHNLQHHAGSKGDGDWARVFRCD